MTGSMVSLLLVAVLLAAPAAAVNPPVFAWSKAARSFPYEHDLRLGHTASSGDVVLQLQELLQGNRPLLLVGLPQLGLEYLTPVACEDSEDSASLKALMTSAPSSLVIPSAEFSLETILKSTDRPQWTGSTQQALEKLASLKGDQILSISCDMSELAALSQSGVDMVVYSKEASYEAAVTSHVARERRDVGAGLDEGNFPRLFLTAPIWMGIIVSLLMITFVLVGSYLLIMTQTPDRFAVATDKNLDVPM